MDAFDDEPLPYVDPRDAAETLIAAVERAGAPWEAVRATALVDRELGGRTWPLVLPDGELLAVIVREPAPASVHDELIRVLLRTFASLVASEERATRVRKRAAAAEREARSDPLTGLLNRRAWDDALSAESARMLRHERPAMVAVIDLDHLKRVNDTDGHLAGDLLIRQAAGAIRGVVREEDVVARIGGDEFAVLAVEAHLEAGEPLLSRLREALTSADVAASVGAAAVAPGTSLVEAFHDADRRMYEVKHGRKGGTGPRTDDRVTVRAGR